MDLSSNNKCNIICSSFWMSVEKLTKWHTTLENSKSLLFNLV